MRTIKNLFTSSRVLRDRKGGTAIEYALVASLIAIAAIAAMGGLGSSINDKFVAVNQAVSGS